MNYTIRLSVGDCFAFQFRTQAMLALPRSQSKRKHRHKADVFFCLLRGPELNRRLKVMSLARYLSSTPLCYSTLFKINFQSALLDHLKLAEDLFILRDSASRQRF